MVLERKRPRQYPEVFTFTKNRVINVHSSHEVMDPSIFAISLVRRAVDTVVV